MNKNYGILIVTYGYGVGVDSKVINLPSREEAEFAYEELTDEVKKCEKNRSIHMIVRRLYK